MLSGGGSSGVFRSSDVFRGRSSGVFRPRSSDVFRQGKSMEINGTTTRIDDNQGQGKDSSRQSLDQRFTDKDQRLPTTARHHQMDNRGGKGQQRHASVIGSTVQRQGSSTTYDCITSSLVNGQGTGQRRRPSVTGSAIQPHGGSFVWIYYSTARRRSSFSGSVEYDKDGQSLVTTCQAPSAVATATGQRQAMPPVAGPLDCNGQQAPSSHSARTNNVCHWTSEQPQHLSIKASAGAQQRITDKAGKSITDARTL